MLIFLDVFLEKQIVISVRPRLAYADCFAAATALQYEATILTGDPEFKKIEVLVQVEWL
jgi:ribonuclease VapC